MIFSFGSIFNDGRFFSRAHTQKSNEIVQQTSRLCFLAS